MNFEFKKASIRDASNMKALNSKILPENYPLYFWIVQLLTSNNSYVAYSKDEHGKSICIGYCLAYPESPTSGLICSLAVHPNYRNNQIGKTLLKMSIDSLKAQHILNIILHVRCDNIIAKNMYLKNGFVIIDIIKNYYGDNDNEDAYLMNYT